LLYLETYLKTFIEKKSWQSKLLMVEGKLQKEGEVIHVILKRCENWSKLLRRLTAANKEDISAFTLSPLDEKDGFPFNAENKKTQVRQTFQEELFPAARNFK